MNPRNLPFPLCDAGRTRKRVGTRTRVLQPRTCDGDDLVVVVDDDLDRDWTRGRRTRRRRRKARASSCVIVVVDAVEVRWGCTVSALLRRKNHGRERMRRRRSSAHSLSLAFFVLLCLGFSEPFFFHFLNRVGPNPVDPIHNFFFIYYLFAFLFFASFSWA